MNQTGYFLRPHSPLVFRSGRPFGSADEPSAGGGGAGYAFPLPSTIAGALRGAWVDAANHAMCPQDQTVLSLHVHGGLRARRPWQPDGTPGRTALYAPMPADAHCVALGGGTRSRTWHMAAAQPMAMVPGSGCNLPHGMLPVAAPNTDKPLDCPPDWSLPALVRWLSLEHDGEVDLRHARPALPRDSRAHVVINPGTLTPTVGGLFQSPGLAFEDAQADEGIATWLLVRPGAPDLATGAALGRHARLGADGATVALEALDPATASQLALPTALKAGLDALGPGDCFRLLLLTPACYLRNGWYPDGLKPTGLGEHAPIEGCLTSLTPAAAAGTAKAALVPMAEGWHLRLVAAATGPWLPLAASKLRDAAGMPGFNRRPMRRLVPAGAVYWLQIVRCGNRPLSDAWLQSTCRTEYARDGFGLSLPGLCAV